MEVVATIPSLLLVGCWWIILFSSRSGNTTVHALSPSFQQHHDHAYLSSFKTFKKTTRNASKWSTRTTTCLRLSDASNTRQQEQQQRGRSKNQNNHNNNNRRLRPKGGRGGGGGGGGGYQQEHIILNKKIAQCENAQEILNLLASNKGSLTLPSGGGTLNAVNFSTSLHRIARYYLSYKHNNNANGGGYDDNVTNNAKFALLICSTSEALAGGGKQIMVDDSVNHPIHFGPQTLSNIAWALSKLNLVPPHSTLPVELTKEATSNHVMEQASKVRSLVYSLEKDPTKNNTGDTTTQNQNQQSPQEATWIPELSVLCGIIQDTISYRVLQSSSRRHRQRQQHQFTIQAYSNLLWALATSQRTNEKVVRYIISNMVQDAKDSIVANNREKKKMDRIELLVLRPQEWANSIWSLATTTTTTTTSIVVEEDGHPEEELLSFVADLMSTYPPSIFLNQFTPQALSNTAWGVATIISKKSNNVDDDPRLTRPALEILRHISQQVTERQAHGFKVQALSNTAWAFATVGFGLPSMSGRGGGATIDPMSLMTTFRDSPILLPSDNPETDREVMMMAMDVIMGKSKDTIRFFKSQGLGNLAWAMAKLEYPKVEMYQMIASQLLTKNNVQKFDPQALSNILWAFATAEVIPESVGSTFDTTTTSLIISGNGTTTSPTSNSEVDPITVCFAMAAEELMRRRQECNTQDISNLLWSFSKIGIRHPRLFRTFAEYLIGNQNMVDKASASAGPQHGGLQDFEPQHLSITAYAYAALGMKHNGFLHSAEEQLLTLVQSFLRGKTDDKAEFTGQELANLIWSFATLNVSYKGLLRDVEPYIVDMCKDNQGRLSVASIAQYMNRQNLANIAWSCAVFGDYPPQLMKVLYLGLLGVGENPDPEYISQIHGDGGMQKSFVTSLIYLQIARDLDGDPTNGVVLPPDFPRVWEESCENGTRNDIVTVEFDELRLTTSKIQLNISNTFKRIGFSHVQEHTIRMDFLAEEHGIQMAATPTEMLSLDIADVSAKIGIEVDGPTHFISQIDKMSQLEDGMQIIANRTDYIVDWNGDDCEMNGSTCLKHRLMEGLGWKIIHIPFWEWNALNGDPVLEEEYCRKVLEEYHNIQIEYTV